MRFLNNRGVSLAGLLVLTAILTVVTSAIVTLALYSSHIVNSVEAKMNQATLAQIFTARMNAIGSTTNYESLCTLSINIPLRFDLAAASTPYTVADKQNWNSGMILNTSGPGSFNIFSILDEPSGNVSNYNLNLMQLRLFNAVPMGVDSTQSYKVYYVDLFASFSMLKIGLGPSTLAPYYMGTFAIFVGALGNIRSCGSINSIPMSTCASIPVDPSVTPVTYEAGIYLPSGYTDANGNATPADPNGCVPISAFKQGNPQANHRHRRGGGGGVTPPKAYSDARLKKVEGDYDYGLAQVMKIRPVWFRYNGLAGTDASEIHSGVVAQELKAIAPKLVETFRAKLHPEDHEATDLLQVRYGDMQMMLLRALQDQQAQIDELTARLKSSKVEQCLK